jgi:hypothetical protein
METNVQKSDKEFLEQALKFYRNIDRYIPVLSIEQEEVEAFKNDIKLFLFIADKRYRSFTESFVRYNIIVLRTRVEYLFAACAASKNYTNKIGEELGIIIPGYKVSWPLGWGYKREISLDWIAPSVK